MNQLGNVTAILDQVGGEEGKKADFSKKKVYDDDQEIATDGGDG
jgi:hypothetical protein